MSGPFNATIVIAPLLESLGTGIAYTAVDPAGKRVHIEQTTLAFDSVSGG